MRIITKKAIVLFLFIVTNYSIATTVTNVQPCTYEPIQNHGDPSKNFALMKCNTWQSDGKSEEVISYKVTNPALTPFKNCFITLEKLNPSSKEKLYAPSVTGICKSHQSGLYISMEYVSDSLNHDKIFNQILKLTSDLEKKGDFVRDRIEMPFYEYWFCKSCNTFLDSINASDSITVRSFNMNYSDSNVATLAIKVNEERWLLSLYREGNEFFINELIRTQ